MIERAKSEMCMYEFDQMSCRRYHHAPERLIKWSSSAYKNQEFNYLDAEGVILLKRGQNDFSYFDKDRQRFLHKHSSEEFNIGSRIPVTLIKANELNGSLTFRHNH